MYSPPAASAAAAAAASNYERTRRLRIALFLRVEVRELFCLLPLITLFHSKAMNRPEFLVPLVKTTTDLPPDVVVEFPYLYLQNDTSRPMWRVTPVVTSNTSMEGLKE
jgi:hypothetical protein